MSFHSIKRNYIWDDENTSPGNIITSRQRSGESNVFSRVCPSVSHFVQRWGLNLKSPVPAPPSAQDPLPRTRLCPHPRTCSNLFNCDLTVQGPSRIRSNLFPMKYVLSKSGRLAFDWNTFLCRFYSLTSWAISIIFTKCLPLHMSMKHMPHTTNNCNLLQWSTLI